MGFDFEIIIAPIQPQTFGMDIFPQIFREPWIDGLRKIIKIQPPSSGRPVFYIDFPASSLLDFLLYSSWGSPPTTSTSGGCRCCCGAGCRPWAAQGRDEDFLKVLDIRSYNLGKQILHLRNQILTYQKLDINILEIRSYQIRDQILSNQELYLTGLETRSYQIRNHILLKQELGVTKSGI